MWRTGYFTCPPPPRPAHGRGGLLRSAATIRSRPYAFPRKLIQLISASSVSPDLRVASARKHGPHRGISLSMIAAGFSQYLHRNLELHENNSETGLIDPSAFRDGVRDMGSSSARQTLMVHRVAPASLMATSRS